ATSTIGFTAGAASRNVTATDAGTSCWMSRLVTGTAAHSQFGSATPAKPATGTASAGLRGSTRRNASAETNAAIAPLTSTPSPGNGRACMDTGTNTVAPA